MLGIFELSLLLAGIFGNCWFWCSYINRLYSLPIHDRVLDRWRKPAEIAVLLVPGLLLISLLRYQGRPGLSSLASAGADPAAWLHGVWLFPALGLVFFGMRVFSRVVSRRPPGYARYDFQILDYVARLGRKPIGQGPYAKLAHMPGNQAFSLELNTKRFVFARLPHAFHQFRILHISDLHFSGAIDREYFEQVLYDASQTKPDLVAFTGDLLDDLRLVSWLPATLGKLQAPLGCYYILGNHDWHLADDRIRDSLKQLGWRECQGPALEIQRGESRIFLAGDERPWMGTAPDLTAVPDSAFRILMSHTPDNIRWARRAGVDLMLSGHNHGGQIKLPGIGAVLAPSRHGVRFADGEFYLPPTTLHVSRGVSGRHPLRLCCRPEISLLQLDCADLV